MTITSTDFQLRVNEYFTKLLQGEEIIIERYGKKLAILKPYNEESLQPAVIAKDKVQENISPKTSVIFTNQELVKIVKILLEEKSTV